MSNVIIVGVVLVDMYVTSAKYPDEGETIIGEPMRMVPGGKGFNTAVAASKLGAKVLFISKTGNDEFGARLDKVVSEHKFSSKIYKTSNMPTDVAIIAMAGKPVGKITVLYSATKSLEPKEIAAIEVGEGDLLISQLETPHIAVESLFEKGRKFHAVNILNLSPIKEVDDKIIALSDIIVMNEIELAHFGKEAEIPTEKEKIISVMKGIRKDPKQILITTLGPKGAIAIYGDEIIEVEGRKVSAIDTTGAGDCFIGGLATKLSGGSGLKESMEYANAAASICVQRLGTSTSMPEKEEVDRVITESV